MFATAKSFVGATALSLLMFNAATADAKSTRTNATHATSTMKAQKTVRVSVRHEYENVASFRGRVDDPLYAYAAEPVPSRMGPVITQWPMSNTVWW